MADSEFAGRSRPLTGAPASELPEALLAALADMVAQNGADSVRASFAQRVLQSGLPRAKDEAWRATPLAILVPPDLRRPQHEKPNRSKLAEELPAPFEGEYRVWIWNGHPVAESTLPPGVSARVSDQPTAFDVPKNGPRDAAFANLNRALGQEQLQLRVDAPPIDTRTAIHLLYVSSCSAGNLLCPRTVLDVSPGTELTLIETFLSADADDAAFSNSVLYANVGEGATLRHLRIHKHGFAVNHVGNIDVSVSAGGRFYSHVISVGGGITRMDLSTHLAGAGAEAELFGLCLARDRQHIEHHTHIAHQADHTQSRQQYRSVLGDRSFGIFDGQVHVHQNAHEVSAHQESRNLLTSEAARCLAKPTLQIEADAVKCTHGATVGELDQDALFYLQSRGLLRAEAQALLTSAFIAPIFDTLPSEPIRQWARHCCHRFMQQQKEKARA